MGVKSHPSFAAKVDPREEMFQVRDGQDYTVYVISTIVLARKVPEHGHQRYWPTQTTRSMKWLAATPLSRLAWIRVFEAKDGLRKIAF